MKRIFSEESLTCIPKSEAYKAAAKALSAQSQEVSAFFAKYNAKELLERYQEAQQEVQTLIGEEVFRQGFHLGREVQKEITEWEQDCE